jgi:hypothetical protein
MDKGRPGRIIRADHIQNAILFGRPHSQALLVKDRQAF